MTCLQFGSEMEHFKHEEILILKQDPYIRAPFRERAKFYEAKKLQEESVTEYYTKLLDLSITCEFKENFDERVLCDKFITGFAAGCIFEHLCDQNKDITLSEALHLALQYEEIQNGTAGMITKSDRTTDYCTTDKLNVPEEVSLLHFIFFFVTKMPIIL